MSLAKVVGVVTPVALIILVAFVFWTLMWKFVLEPNPLIREFFDLDLKKSSKKCLKSENQLSKEQKKAI
jgi:hypothetical protein